MTSLLITQTPGDAGGMLDVLLNAASEAVAGGGIFAWTNAAGASALIDDNVFKEFLDRGSFDLVVGVDSITDPPALYFLADRSETSSLETSAFLNDSPGMFHPKLAWFLGPDQHMTLIVGSANLTMGGLKNNWEAFSVVQLDPDEADALILQLAKWREDNEQRLRHVLDHEVLELAERNAAVNRAMRRGGSVPPEPPTPPSNVMEVLVAEIPKSGNRWAQANFDRDNYVNFFGAVVGGTRRIFLQHVADDRTLGPLESRPSVEVESQNYRFELEAARGRDYPETGRPIGVFIKTAEESFIYHLTMPGDPGYAELEEFLEGRATRQRETSMARVRATVGELKAAWPDSPLWDVDLGGE